MHDPVRDQSPFIENWKQLLEEDIARRFFSEVVARARRATLLFDVDYSVNGTAIQAWTAMKEFRTKDGCIS